MVPDRVAATARAADVSFLERHSLLAGVFLIVFAAGASLEAGSASGGIRAVGLAGLATLALCAGSRGARLYRAGRRAALPASVGRTVVRIRPGRAFGALAVALSLGLPVAVTVAILVLVEWAWLPVSGMLLFGCAGMWLTWARQASDARPYWMSSEPAERALERLCLVADIAVPEVVVEHDVAATAWTTGGRIHVTSPLLDLLDERELEAVLAHEVAHIARRDAAVMEICSAPSRLLLSFASFLTPRLGRWSWNLVRDAHGLGLVGAVLLAVLAALCVPPALLVGWFARLSVLGMSRGREFAADAAAATLTGRPTALASALMKLEHQCAWAPHADLRQARSDEALDIVGRGRPRLGRLFSSHPATDARTARLQAIERRLQNA